MKAYKWEYCMAALMALATLAGLVLFCQTIKPLVWAFLHGYTQQVFHYMFVTSNGFVIIPGLVLITALCAVLAYGFYKQWSGAWFAWLVFYGIGLVLTLATGELTLFLAGAILWIINYFYYKRRIVA